MIQKNKPIELARKVKLHIERELPEASDHTLRLAEATPADLDRIMELEQAGFAAGHQELRATYALRIATFPQGSLLAWLGDACVGCVFTEIWHFLPLPPVECFTLGHDIRERHDAVRGTELYISSMTLAPSVRGMGLGAPLLMGTLSNAVRSFPGLVSALLLVHAGWKPARRIYAQAGFAQLSSFEGFFGPQEDGIVMRRPLNDLRAIKLVPPVPGQDVRGEIPV
mgnify:CR=1 FL=1